AFYKKLSSIIFFLFLSISLFCQHQQLADSLETIYVTGDFEEEKRLEILRKLAIHQHDLETKLKYSNELLALAKEMESSTHLYIAYLEKGNSFAAMGELTEAVENYFLAGDIAIKNDDFRRLASVWGSIANVYREFSDMETSITYYRKSIEEIKKNLLRKRDTIWLGSSLMNLGHCYIYSNKPDSALIYFNESENLFKQINFRRGLAYNDANKGLAYVQKRDFINAQNSLNNSLPIFETLGDFEGLSETLIDYSNIYFLKNDFDRATEFALEGLSLAEEHNMKPLISEASHILSKIYSKTGKHKEALKFYEDYVTFKDSVTNLSTVLKTSNMRNEFEVAQKQTEIDLKQSEVELLNQQKSNLRILAFSMIALLGLTGFYFRNIRKAKRRSDDLLLNILPSSTAQELKEHGKVKAKKFDAVTVMFTDFQAFTRYSENLSPEVLVKSVDFFFSKFDEIIDKFELEKIKTIGDAYMCAGGLTHVSKDEVIKILQAAFEIKKFVEKMRHSSDDSIAHFNIRIGINTGAVVAGVVGTKKFAYDIWGDTVNIASRMESNSDAGRINVSENTYQLIRDHFDCEYRGEIDVKNKGMMKMYFVNGAKKNPQNPVKDKSFEVLC
ncbi:MAG: tetratricopeptide repeat protein, partial [Flavobacteriaceae bacterium]